MKTKRRVLGRTGLSVPEIGFGCGPTADLMINGSARERRAAVHTALELGIDYFDTAPVYGDGASEANLGATLRDLGARPVIASKVALEAADMRDIAGAVVRSVQDSVERLGMPVTLIQLHNRIGVARAPKAEFGSGALLTVQDVLGPGGVVEAFESLRERKLVKFFGCSAYGGAMDCVSQLVESGKFDCIILSYSILNQTAWTDAGPHPAPRDYCRIGAHAAQAGMGTIALRVLEAGVLAGADPMRITTSPSADRLRMAAQLPALHQLLRQERVPLTEAAIRFALSNPAVSVVLLGMSDKAQVEQAARCSNSGPLPAALIDRIEQLRLRGFAPATPAA
jgi:aryl-alcohol dehydrogenase-like predicted oxidoreductase